MASFKSELGQTCRALVMWLALFAAIFAQNVFARDAFVMLSGGHSPFDNNYSQYLQAKAVVTYFEQHYPANSIWVFFGSGNAGDKELVFCDVRREVRRDGLNMDSWLAGTLSHNRPARRDVILRALREEILPTVADGGTLYLFVGDHGSQTRGPNGESVIDLWSLERDSKSSRQWRSTTNETLSVSELRRVLAKGLGKGRVVFCMTQCHSGGFHHLAVPREMTPNPKWFTMLPSWASPKNDITFVRAAGFTATDERSLAAGCQADPDPERWAGYERFIPEHLLGMNLFTLARADKGLRSFAEAHIAATLVDQTIDKPYSTSEQYLERWANLIETRLAKEPSLTPKVNRAVAAYQRTVDGATPKELDLTFRDRQAMFRRFTDKLVEQNPSVKDLLRNGTRKELEQAIGGGRGRTSNQTNAPSRTQRQNNNSPAARRDTTNAASETVKLWNVVRPVWQKTIEEQRPAALPSGAVEFEKFLLREEKDGRDFFSTVSRGKLREEAFWHSGYSNPQTLDAAKAESVIRWSMERRPAIIAWAKTCDDEAVREAGEKLFARTPRRTNAAPSLTPSSPTPLTNQPSATLGRISKKVAAERTLFYRRVLGAWEFLLAMNERPALAMVRELTELERTPLPRPEKQ